jgi:hypothetical protein
MTTLTLKIICEALEGALTDVRVWTESGYIYLDTGTEIFRLSLDRVRSW